MADKELVAIFTVVNIQIDCFPVFAKNFSIYTYQIMMISLTFNKAFIYIQDIFRDIEFTAIVKLIKSPLQGLNLSIKFIYLQ